ncbi:MAG TPA: FAD-linked oxidase C-terminal domain-containing protein [Gaiellaceae bacterium]|nr:FAD-linked oxidase C-terminal domain-containing protein [Gaiellaceae bacterium]
MDVVARLRDLVTDPAAVSDDDDVREAHGRDISPHPPRSPEVVVFPSATAEIQAVLRFAGEHRLAVVPFGLGTSVEGQVIPVEGGISLDLSRMREILDVRPDDFLARVQAGVTRVQLNERLAHEGVFFPVDPGVDASIGGMVGTNASGTNAVRYGVMRDNVLGVEAVLADGTILRTGGMAVKSSAGYDLTRLFVGSEGTLGVISEVTLRIHRLPQFVMAARAVFPDLHAAAHAATRLIQSGMAIARVELLDEVTIAAVNAYSGTAYPARPTLFLEFSGSEVSVRHDVATAERIAAAAGAGPLEAEEDEEARARLWDARHHAALAIMATAPAKKLMSTDVCVPVSALADAVAEARRVVEAEGVTCAILGHVGDGNYHTVFMVDPDDEAEVARAARINAEIVRFALSRHGTCTGEHGIGLGKRAYLREERGAAVDAMQAIKRALDPNGILNPGKVLG